MKKDLFENVLDNLYDGLYFVDTKRKITLWNKAAQRLSGYSAEEVNGKYCFDNMLDHIDVKGNHLCFGGCPLHATMQDGESREAAVYLKRKDGKRIPVVVKTMPIYEDGKIIGATEIFNDNYQLFKALKDLNEFKDMAFTDKLTGLPNRHFVEEFLNQSEFFGRIGLSIIFLDIDDFKFVNDTYGHSYGDVVLQEVGKAVKGVIKRSDEVFRYGGEEFMAFIFDDEFDNAVKVAERIRRTVENLNLEFEGKPTPITISVGVTMMHKGEELLTAIDRSDQCMYQSKVSGKNKVTSEM